MVLAEWCYGSGSRPVCSGDMVVCVVAVVFV